MADGRVRDDAVTPVHGSSSLWLVMQSLFPCASGRRRQAAPALAVDP
jgi:hypothetical protein